MSPRVLVVGAGPTGAQAAHQLLSRGLEVEMLDFGVTDPRRWDAPGLDHGFVAFRTGAHDQSKLLWGDDYSEILTDALQPGAGLTPPREFVGQEVAGSIPIRAREFIPVESLAKGGLGEAWGLGAFALGSEELRAIGLPEEAIRRSYERVSARIGISGGDLAGSLPELELDEVAETLWNRYRRREARFAERRLHARRMPTALLSRPHQGREATPYTDLDFYLNPGRSAYRPAFDVDALGRDPRFTYTAGWLALTVRDGATGAEVDAISRDHRRRRTFGADAIVLCAGTLGTARIVLRSGVISGDGGRLRLACSPYFRMVAVLPGHVGRVLRDRRHSLAQIVLTLDDGRRPGWLPHASLLSYRSFLLTRLMREAPIPVRQARAMFQLLQSGIVVAGIFVPQLVEEATARVWLEPDPQSATGDRLVVEDQPPGAEARAEQDRVLASFGRALRLLGAIPLRTQRRPAGTSIHYGGTLPFGADVEPATGQLRGCERVFVGDGSPFRMVPGKGITLTLMAYADWVADRVADRIDRLGAAVGGDQQPP